MALDVRKLVNELFAKSEAKPAENKPAPPPPSAKAPPAQPIAPKAPEPAAKAPMGDAKPAEKRPEFKGADDSIYHQTQVAIKNGVRYNGNSKDSKALGEDGLPLGIECSGWVAETQRNMVKSLQSQLDNPKSFVAETRRLVTDHAAGIIDNFAKAGAPVLTGADLKKQGPREGMLIGEDNGRPNQGRPRDIDHIVQTVKGPDGQIWVSESRGGKSQPNGVMLTKYEDYIAAKEKMGAKLYAVDAYQHYDKMTNGQFSTLAAPQKAVETAVGTPQTQQTSSSPVRSLVDAVRPTELEYVESTPPLPSTDADTLAINTPPPAPATPEEVHEHLQQMTP